MNDEITVGATETLLRILAVIGILLVGLLGLFMSLCGGTFLIAGLLHQDGSLGFWPIAAPCAGAGVALVWLCGRSLWRRWNERRAAARVAR